MLIVAKCRRNARPWSRFQIDKGKKDEANRLVAALPLLYMGALVICSQKTPQDGITNLYSWVYPTEKFPLASRAKGVDLATVTFSIAGRVINEIIPHLINAIGILVFILFTLIHLIMLIPIDLFYIGKWSRFERETYADNVL